MTTLSLFESLLESLNDGEKLLYSKEYNGEAGNSNHLTKVEDALLSINKAKKIKGKNKENHQFTETHFGNYTREEWGKFLEEMKTEGQKDPILIVVDDWGPRVYEGNHRIQAAIQLGWKTIRAEIKYFGHSEQTYELMR